MKSKSCSLIFFLLPISGPAAQYRPGASNLPPLAIAPVVHAIKNNKIMFTGRNRQSFNFSFCTPGRIAAANKYRFARHLIRSETAISKKIPERKTT